MRAVMDTNVLIAAFRSRRGALFEVFQRLRLGEWTAVVSNHLLYEYEEILKRDVPLLGLSLDDVDTVLNAVCARAEEWPLSPVGSPFSVTPMMSHLPNWRSNPASAES